MKDNTTSSKNSSRYSKKGFDCSDLSASYTKNIEALRQAHQKSMEVCQGIAQMHLEYLKHTTKDFTDFMQKAHTHKNPQDSWQVHSEAFSQGFSKATDHSRKVAQSLQNAAHDVSNLMKHRFHEAVAEAKHHVKNMKKWSPQHATPHSWMHQTKNSYTTKH